MDIRATPARERFQPAAVPRRIYRVLGHGESSVATRIEGLLERARGLQGFDHASLATVRVHLGEVLIGLERPRDARAHLDGALALLGSGPSGERERERMARVRLLAAKAWARGEGADLGRARGLAEAAIEDYRALDRVDSVAEVQSWLGSLDRQATP